MKNETLFVTFILSSILSLTAYASNQPTARPRILTHPYKATATKTVPKPQEAKGVTASNQTTEAMDNLEDKPGAVNEPMEFYSELPNQNVEKQ